MESNPEPRAVELVSPALLRIEWKDGLVSEFEARKLRLACPCAVCVEEGSGRRLLQDEAVAADIQLLEAELVGRYALCFQWSDRHKTGIFSWRFLRAMSPES